MNWADDGARRGGGKWGRCSLLLRLKLEREMGLGLRVAAPRSKINAPGGSAAEIDRVVVSDRDLL